MSLTATEHMHTYLKKNPWAKTRVRIMTRCNRKSDGYFKKGIKNFLTTAQLKELWFRDKAYLMDRPSIDRIDPSGNYEMSNCRYLELSLNCAAGGKGRPCIQVLQYDLNGNFIKKWQRCKDAVKELNIFASGISKCINGQQSKSSGFIWKRVEDVFR